MPLTTTDLTYLILGLMFLAALIWRLPSCGHPMCSAAHAKHSADEHARQAELTHATYHADYVSPTCVLCQAKRRDRP